jgi:hypothetical protein
LLNFFVENNVEIKKIAEILRQYNFSVRIGNFAVADEIAFFYNENHEGFCFSAYRFQENEIPDCVCCTPFLVSVGKKWNEEGLMNVVQRYLYFLLRGLPVFDTETMSRRRVINICKRCITLPWGEFPNSIEGQRKLVLWLEKAKKVILSQNGKDNNIRLTFF